MKSQLLLKRYISSDRNRFPSLSPSFMAIKFKSQYRPLPPFQREWLGGILKSLQSPNKASCLLFQTCYEMERYLKDEPKLQSYKKLPTELDTAPWNLFRAPSISWTTSTGTSAQFDPPIKMEVCNQIAMLTINLPTTKLSQRESFHSNSNINNLHFRLFYMYI